MVMKVGLDVLTRSVGPFTRLYQDRHLVMPVGFNDRRQVLAFTMLSECYLWVEEGEYKAPINSEKKNHNSLFLTMK
jgi:hypothetical protein